jgi:cytochrome c oxidase cbb3-type subunit 3
MLNVPSHKKIMKTSTATIAFLVLALTAGAKGGGTGPAADTATNWLEVLLVFIAIVLLLVIWGLGQVLLTFGKQLNDKKRSGGTLPALILFFLSLGASIQVSAQAKGATDATAAAAADASNYGGLSTLEFYALATVILLEVVVIFFLAFMGRRMYRELTARPLPEGALVREESNLQAWWSNLDKKIFTRAGPVEQEADVMLDHDYDGIRELDNALPPWWKYGFYITIVVAVFYIFNFHVFGTGKNPEQEYAEQMAEGKRVEEAYKARTKSLVDENNVTLADADGIAAGKAIFTKTCSPCHMADGGGGIGPNLTDDYWLHGGGLNDIFHTIKLGYPDKGMQAWQSVFEPAQIRDLASFVKSLHGTKPANPKAPQGDLYTAAAPVPAAQADSTKTAVKPALDSAAKK